MTASAIIAIRDAAADAFEAAPALVPAGRVLRGRNVPLPAQWGSGIDVLVDGSDPAGTELMDGSVHQRSTTLLLRIKARGGPGTDAETEADDLLQACTARLIATDPPAGVMSWGRETRTRWRVDEADDPSCTITCAMRVDHWVTSALLPAT